MEAVVEKESHGQFLCSVLPNYTEVLLLREHWKKTKLE